MRLAFSGVVLALALASCAPGGPARQADTPSLPPGRAVIVAVRPVPPNAVQAARLLRAEPDGGAVRDGAAEYILRTGDGMTLSVVQAVEPALHPGQEVTISRVDKTAVIVR